jgi:pilus assembly protein CpaF
MAGDTILLIDIFGFRLVGHSARGQIIGRYEVSRIRPSFYEKLDYFKSLAPWGEALEGGVKAFDMFKPVA